MSSDKRLKVIYIAGYGRSGSTVLDISLGEHPAIFGGGEITALTRHVWAKNEYCSCGSRIQQCELWSAIIDEWLGEESLSLIKRYGELQKRFESVYTPLAVQAGVDKGQDFAEYSRHTLSLFQAIATVTGNQTIVDSSKIPGRALAFSLIEGMDLRVIHLIRDARAVAWSMLQRYERNLQAGLQKDLRPKPVSRTAIRWSLINLATEWYCRRLETDHYTRVRYEEFTEEPDQVFRRVSRSLGIDISEIGNTLARGDAIHPHHQVAGSRLRMKREIKLRQDDRWKSKMPFRKQNHVRWLCSPLLRRYGYL